MLAFFFLATAGSQSFHPSNALLRAAHLGCCHLGVDSLTGNRLKLYQAKTGEPVSVLIPPYFAEALRSVQHKNPRYFFWSGERGSLKVLN